MLQYSPAFNIKPSNIRIWIHDKDIGKLTKVLLEGQGMRLRNETSNNPKVKKFLENVPHVMVSEIIQPSYALLTSTHSIRDILRTFMEPSLTMTWIC
jgi:hypothetical protein